MAVQTSTNEVALHGAPDVRGFTNSRTLCRLPGENIQAEPERGSAAVTAQPATRLGGKLAFAVAASVGIDGTSYSADSLI